MTVNENLLLNAIPMAAPHPSSPSVAEVNSAKTQDTAQDVFRQTTHTHIDHSALSMLSYTASLLFEKSNATLAFSAALSPVASVMNPYPGSLNRPFFGSHNPIERIKLFTAQQGKEGPVVRQLVESFYHRLFKPSTSIDKLIEGVQFFTEWGDEGNDQTESLMGHLSRRLYESGTSVNELIKGAQFFTKKYGKEGSYAPLLTEYLCLELRKASVSDIERKQAIEFFREEYGDTHLYTIELLNRDLFLTVKDLDLVEKKAFAKQNWETHPERLAHQLFVFFTAEDINADRDFFDPLVEKSLKSSSSDQSYLLHHKMYLNRCREQHAATSSTNSAHANDCHHWQCLGEEPPGYLVFKLRWQHDSLAQGASSLGAAVIPDNNPEIFPTEEPTIENLDDPEAGFAEAHFQQLGFRYEKNTSGVYLVIPTTEQLKINWKKFQAEYEKETQKKLRDFICGDSQELDTSKAYVEKLRVCDVVVARTGRFVLHDVFIHLMGSISSMKEDPDAYEQTLEAMRKIGTIVQAAQNHEAYKENPRIYAKVQILNELSAILHDYVTAQNENEARNNIIKQWHKGDYSETMSPMEWVPILRKNEESLALLTALEIDLENPKWPEKKLHKMWRRVMVDYHNNKFIQTA